MFLNKAFGNIPPQNNFSYAPRLPAGSLFNRNIGGIGNPMARTIPTQQPTYTPVQGAGKNAPSSGQNPMAYLKDPILMAALRGR